MIACQISLASVCQDSVPIVLHMALYDSLQLLYKAATLQGKALWCRARFACFMGGLWSTDELAAAVTPLAPAYGISGNTRQQSLPIPLYIASDQSDCSESDADALDSELKTEHAADGICDGANLQKHSRCKAHLETSPHL